MKSLKTICMLAIAAGSLALAGCATDSGAYRPQVQQNQYNTQQNGQVFGVIQSVRPTNVQVANASGVGMVGGAVAGGVIGNQIGKGNGRKVATFLGIIGGGVAGNEIERRNNVMNVPGVELQVRTDSGQMFNVIQQDQGQGFRPGTRVRLVQNGGNWIASY